MCFLHYTKRGVHFSTVVEADPGRHDCFELLDRQFDMKNTKFEVPTAAPAARSKVRAR